MVLVQLVEKWPNIFEIQPDLNISDSIWYKSDAFQKILV